MTELDPGRKPASSGAGAIAAHYLSDYLDVDGIVVATKHRIVARTPDGESLAEPSSSRSISARSNSPDHNGEPNE